MERNITTRASWKSMSILKERVNDGTVNPWMKLELTWRKWNSARREESVWSGDKTKNPPEELGGAANPVLRAAVDGLQKDLKEEMKVQGNLGSFLCLSSFFLEITKYSPTITPRLPSIYRASISLSYSPTTAPHPLVPILPVLYLDPRSLT